MVAGDTASFTAANPGSGFSEVQWENPNNSNNPCLVNNEYGL